MKIGEITILISDCPIGIYLRWWYNGWHYFNFQNGYEIMMKTESMDTQVTQMFSRISKIERSTKIKAEYSYEVNLDGIKDAEIEGFTGLILAEKVQQYEGTKWYDVSITRGSHIIKNADSEGYVLNFQVARKELPLTSTVIQKAILLYIDNVLADIDDDEVIPINKQVNDIAELQDRQSDFTMQFKIRKTRAMRSLFELSGEVGINTSYPFEKHTCRLVQESVEMITNGMMYLNSVDNDYYYVSLLSGNHNLFNGLEKLKLSDIQSLADIDWNITQIAASHNASPEPDYLFPLCEPSDDAKILELTLVGNLIGMWGGNTWPFVKVELLWNYIFSEAGYIVQGDILSNPLFQGLYIPIASLELTNDKANRYLFSGDGIPGDYVSTPTIRPLTTINGDANFAAGIYVVPYSAKYTFRIHVAAQWGSGFFELWDGGAKVATFVINSELTTFLVGVWDCTYEASSGDTLDFRTPPGYVYYINISVVKIDKPLIGLGSIVTPTEHLPDITQSDFIKMICNMFALVPTVNARDKIVRFWSYSDIYSNVSIARDWSDYLSETEDDVEFKFGDYAQNNYLKYKESDDVLKNNGTGVMQVDDYTLHNEKDIIQLPFSTCDEVVIGTTVPFTVSRINMNIYNETDALYDQNKKIDPRIVYVKRITGRTYKVWNDENNEVSIINPRAAVSLDIAFSNMVHNYSWLSRLLTKTNHRHEKFNLPVFEVSGIRHEIPIYLRQRKACFYVNKINNYIPGKLCKIDLIQL